MGKKNLPINIVLSVHIDYGNGQSLVTWSTSLVVLTSVWLRGSRMKLLRCKRGTCGCWVSPLILLSVSLSPLSNNIALSLMFMDIYIYHSLLWVVFWYTTKTDACLLLFDVLDNSIKSRGMHLGYWFLMFLQTDVKDFINLSQDNIPRHILPCIYVVHKIFIVYVEQNKINNKIDYRKYIL